MKQSRSRRLEVKRIYYRTHSKQILKKQKSYYWKNHKRILAVQKIYREKNPNCMREWRRRNRKWISTYSKVYNKENQDRRREWYRSWVKRKPEIKLAGRHRWWNSLTKEQKYRRGVKQRASPLYRMNKRIYNRQLERHQIKTLSDVYIRTYLKYYFLKDFPGAEPTPEMIEAKRTILRVKRLIRQRKTAHETERRSSRH